MRVSAIVSLLLVLVLMPGCKTVYSDHLIGEEIAAGDAEDLEGVWRFGESTMHVKHVGGGEFVAAFLEWEEDGFEMRHMDLVVTEHAGVRILHAIVEEEEDHDEDGDEDMDEGEEDEDEMDDDDRPWIVCGLLTGEDEGAVVLSAPQFERLAEAIEAGDLEGEVNEDDNELFIHSDKEVLDSLIEEELLHEFFHLQEPIVITRLGDL